MRILHHKFSSIALLTVFASQLHQALAFGSTAKYNKDSSGCRRDFLNSAIITTTGVIVGMPKNAYAKTMVDTNNDYPGTAVERLENVRARVATLSEEDLSGD